MSREARSRARWRRSWDRQAASYDRTMSFLDRVLFKDSREWVCTQAQGHTLEVAIGTGLNIPAYSGEVTLSGVDLSPAMLKVAQDRAFQQGREVVLQLSDAEQLPFADATFDAVVCTFSLCGIPEPATAVAEMSRVLKPGGLLLLADHVAAANLAVRGVQRLLELVTVPLEGEHFLGRPSQLVREAGFHIEAVQRFNLGIVERLAARKP